MSDEDWDDGPSVSVPASNNIGFGMPGAGRGFKASNEVSGFQERKPGGFGDRESKGFGDRESKGFGDRESKGFGDRESKRFGGGGNKSYGGDGDGESRRGGGGFRGDFNNRNENGEPRGFVGGGSRGFGTGNNDDGEDAGGAGYRGGRGGGGARGRGRGGGGAFGRRNDGDDDAEGGGGGARGFVGGGGRGSFSRRNNDENGRDRGDDEDGAAGGRGGRGGGRGGRGGGGGDRDGGDGEKPREIYVPKERDENDMYNDGTRAGINFKKYDAIDVKTSGDRAPPAISTFEEAGLRSLLYDNMKKCGYTTPTPVQKYSIPIVLSNRDLMACAQTGSGKTAAFMVPIIHRLLEKPREIEDMKGQSCVEPRAVIVAPTRELAIQTHEAAVKLSKGSVLFARIAYGGAAMGDQMRKLFAGCDILVATPGRLLGLVGMGKVAFGAVEFVVLDEADRMLDMGFIGDVEKVLKHETMTPVGERNTLMFSATFPTAIQQLAGKYLHEYLFVAVGIVGGACTDIEQIFMEVGKREKRNKIKELLEIEKSEGTLKGILVFVESKRQADFIAAFLSEQGYPTTSIHGDRLQREREEALYDFKSGRMGILVATAVAARGLDIQCARHVINFDLPQEIDEYIHRIGRTGRVGNKGKATSFYDGDIDHRIKDDLLRILNQAGQPVPDWLESGGGGRSFGPASSFGGQDIRSFSDVQDSFRGAAQPVEEEEQW